MTDNTQYKWRQRKKRKSLLTVWLVAVVVLAALGTFAYKGLYEGNPKNIAKKYLEQGIGVSEYELTAGPRSLNDQNLFEQEYTVKYTADGKEEVKKLNLIQQEEKKYGIFEQWDFEKQETGDTMKIELIAPITSQVLVNSVAPADSEVKVDQEISAGAVCYDLTGVEVGAKVQVNGLPFDSFETVITEEDKKIDLRDQLVVGDNARTQMEELAKTMINELFTAVMQEQDADSLSELFDHAPNKENLFKAIKTNLYDGKERKVSSMTFKEFEPAFGEVYYPGSDEEAYIGMEMTLTYTCDYTMAEKKEEGSEEQETEKSKTPAKKISASKEAKFYFKYIDGECVVTSMEVPNVII